MYSAFKAFKRAGLLRFGGLRQLAPSMVLSQLLCLAFFQALFLTINLVGAILAAIFFDEDAHGVHLLALVWAGYAFGDGLLVVAAKRWTCCHLWGECLLRVLMEAGQGALYVYFCRADDAMMWLFIVLVAIQILLKLIETMLSYKASTKDEVKTLDASDETQHIVPVTGLADSCTCCRPDYLKLVLHLVADILIGVLPLLFQKESPFRDKWYQIYVCVMIWWKPLLLRLLPLADTGRTTRLFCFNLVTSFLLYTGMVWSWGLSPNLLATWDRVYTIIGMVFSSLICLGCCCACCFNLWVLLFLPTCN